MKKELNNNDTHENTGRFEEQEAPEKNTDNAFVKVGRDGQPEIPGQDKDETEEKEKGSRDIR